MQNWELISVSMLTYQDLFQFLEDLDETGPVPYETAPLILNPGSESLVYLPQVVSDF